MVRESFRPQAESVGKGRVAVVGESIMDVVDGLPIPGGSAANVALGLARRGIDTTFATSLADDEYGHRILTRLRGAGVEIAPGSVSAEHTSTAIATRGPDGDVDYRFDVAWETPELGVIGELEVLHIGSVPALSDAGRSRLLERLRSAGQRCVTFDPNIRPALAPPRAVAVERVLEIVRAASIVKLSDEDAGWLFPGRDLARVTRELLAAGPRLVVVTRGAAGLTLTSNTADVAVPTEPVKVKDTIGAGDTVMTSLIAAELAGWTGSLDRAGLERIGTAAARAASITVARAGADMPSLRDLERLDRSPSEAR